VAPRPRQAQLRITLNGDNILESPRTIPVLDCLHFDHVGTAGRVHDEEGILYYLATAGRTRPWLNPAKQGIVKVDGTRAAVGSLEAIVDVEVQPFYTISVADAWISVEIIGYVVRPTGFVISRGRLIGPTSFVLQASLDGQHWVDIIHWRRHHGVDLSHIDGSMFVSVNTADAFWSHFRLRQTCPNELYGNSVYYNRYGNGYIPKRGMPDQPVLAFAVSALELYGDLKAA